MILLLQLPVAAPKDTLRVHELTTWLLQPASTNVRVLAWVIGMIAVLIFLRVMAGKLAHLWMMHSKDITQWVGQAPTTNLRVLVGIALAIIFVLGSMLALVIGIELSGETLLYIGGFILLQMGLDVAAYGVKRATFKPEALGMTRESINPAPQQPAAAIVAATGEQAVETPAEAAAAPPSPITVTQR